MEGTKHLLVALTTGVVVDLVLIKDTLNWDHGRVFLHSTVVQLRGCLTGLTLSAFP